jgi:hypothetical protein
MFRTIKSERKKGSQRKNNLCLEPQRQEGKKVHKE